MFLGDIKTSSILSAYKSFYKEYILFENNIFWLIILVAEKSLNGTLKLILYYIIINLDWGQCFNCGYVIIITQLFIFDVVLYLFALSTRSKRNANLFSEVLTGWLLKVTGLSLIRNELDSTITECHLRRLKLKDTIYTSNLTSCNPNLIFKNLENNKVLNKL